jgi:hypothetical protein
MYGPNVFRGRRRPSQRAHQLLVSLAPRVASELIDAHPDGGPVQPSGGLLASCLCVPPPFQEHLDGQLLGAAWIAPYPSQDTGNPGVVRNEGCLEFGVSLANGGDWNGIALCVHIPRTLKRGNL